MAQSETYENEEYADDGLTFRKIGAFIKTAWIRMIVYAVIVVALVAVVALPIKYFYKSEKMATTTIEFIYSGIEQGETPNGGTFNSDDIISTVVLADAVEAAGLSDKLTNISELRENMRVESVLTQKYLELTAAAANGDSSAIEQLRTYVMYPTQFNIVISEPSELGLTDTQAKQLLDEVVKSYTEYFRKSYSLTDMFSVAKYNLASNDTYEFADVYDIYVQSLDTVSGTLAVYDAEAPDFVSTAQNSSFGTLVGTLAELKLEYSAFNNYILVNNVWRSPEVAKDTLAAEKTLIEVSSSNLDAYIANLESMIASIKPNTITSVDSTGHNIVTETYPAKYYEYLDMLNDAHLELLGYAERLSNIEIRLGKLNESAISATDEQKKTAEEMLVALERKTSEFVSAVNAVITDYYDTTFISQSVRHVRPAVVTSKSSDLNVLIIFACAVIVGLIIGGIVTGVKMAKRTKRNKAVAAQKAAEAVKPAEQVEADKADK